MKLIYLASPYLYRGPDADETFYIDTHATKGEVIAELRYESAIDATAYLMKKGLAVYSPIVATHPVAVKHELPKGSEYWLQFDEIILSKCDEIVVLMIDGWKESPGVQREIEIMKNLHKDITYLEPKMIK